MRLRLDPGTLYVEVLSVVDEIFNLGVMRQMLGFYRDGAEPDEEREYRIFIPVGSGPPAAVLAEHVPLGVELLGVVVLGESAWYTHVRLRVRYCADPVPPIE